eukprot:gene10607-22145_t
MQSEVYALKREADFIRNGEVLFRQFISDLDIKESSTFTPTIAEDESFYEEEKHQLEARLKLANEERNQLRESREKYSYQIHEIKALKDTLQLRLNSLNFEYQTLLNHQHSLSIESSRTKKTLKELMQINIMNDAFYIWHAGPFATINNFRIGKLQSHQVDWTETNAALGQAAFIISAIAIRANITFHYYDIHPMGSFAKITKNDETSNVVYNLFTDGAFSLFPKRNFNGALIGFLTCIKELGDYIMERDPTLQLPYVIQTDKNTINDLSIILTNGDEEIWTKALKYVLTDVKWIIAWATKHLHTIKDCI